jgi:O-antigen ligase
MSELKKFFMLVQQDTITNRIIMLILLCYPALLLTVNGSMGILYFLLLIVSLVCLYNMRASLHVPHWDGCSIAFAIAMASPVVAIFLSQAYHGNFKAMPYDWASRFLLCIPIYLALRQTNIRTTSILQLAFPIGTLVGLAVLKLHPYIWLEDRATTSPAFNLIHFSDTALMLGFLSLFCINWGRKDHPLILTLKICAFLAGVYMSVQSGERGAWLAIPPLLLLWVISHTKKNLALKLSIATLVVICMAWLSYSQIGIVHHRVDSIFSDLASYSNNNNKETSVGARLQLWQAAIKLFINNPIFGIGPNEFAHAMPSLYAQGMLTPYAAQMGGSEVHNEILEKCADTGLFGLLAIISVYIVPIFIFWRSTKSSESTIKYSAFMGIGLVLGFFIFGLTVEIFNLKMTAAFFSLTLAVLMAEATHKGNH